jgi:hypothetical protein
MPLRTRRSPLTWKQMLDAADLAEARISEVLLHNRLPRHSRTLLSTTRQELRAMLIRAGRRPTGTLPE